MESQDKLTVNVIGQIGKVQTNGVLDVGPLAPVKAGCWSTSDVLILKLGPSVLQQQSDGLSQLEQERAFQSHESLTGLSTHSSDIPVAQDRQIRHVEYSKCSQ